MSRFVDDNLDGMTLRRKYACPVCGEDRVEFLVEHQEGIIDCASCGTVYDPIYEAEEERNGTSETTDKG